MRTIQQQLDKLCMYHDDNDYNSNFIRMIKVVMMMMMMMMMMMKDC